MNANKQFTGKLPKIHMIIQRHIEAHSGEKFYQCSQCDNGYTTSSDFKRHIETHTGEKS